MPEAKDRIVTVTVWREEGYARLARGVRYEWFHPLPGGPPALKIWSADGREAVVLPGEKHTLLINESYPANDS